MTNKMDGSVRHTYFRIVLIITLVSGLAEGLVCYSGQNMHHLEDSRRIVECTRDEECYSQMVINSTGSIFYNMGCASVNVCSLQGTNTSLGDTPIKSQRQVRLDATSIILCFGCCNKTNYCNKDRCARFDTIPTQIPNRASCLSCPAVKSPDECELTTPCDVDEVCYTELIRVHGEDRYRMGCVKKESCDASPVNASRITVGRRFLTGNSFTDYCGKCCKDDVHNCNRDLCRQGAALTSGTPVYRGLLRVPPAHGECEDVDKDVCLKHLRENPSSCSYAAVGNYVCRKSCGCGTGTVPQVPDKGQRLPETDCFYESTRYLGSYNMTVAGHSCVSWDYLYQHLKSNVTAGPGFPEHNIRDAENKCRDPTGKGHPWCYTSSSLDWEFCPVPYCAECFYKGKSKEYNGYVSKDAKNATCLQWSDYSHNLPIQDSMFSDGSAINASNRCRDVFNLGLYCSTAHGFSACNIAECSGVCHDDPNTNCTLIKDFVCMKEYFRKTLCPKTCNDCGFGLLPPKIITPPTPS